MKTKQLVRTGAAALLGLMCQPAAELQAQTDSVAWYQGGALVTWQVQPDVYAFRCVGGGGMPCAIDTTLIDQVVHQAHRHDKAVEVYFKPGSTAVDRAAFIASVQASPAHEQDFVAVSQDAAKSWEYDEWYVLDDQILVNFKDPFLSASAVSAWAAGYDLVPVSMPGAGLPAGGRYTHVFRLGAGLLPAWNAASYSRKIGFSDTLALNVEPNFANLRQPRPFAGAGIHARPVAPPPLCPMSDTLFPYMWHIDNQGAFWIGAATPTSTLDADADICECWDKGLTGDGVRIAVLGIGGHDYTHPDIGTGWGDGWDCSVTPCVALSKTAVPTDVWPYGGYAASLLGADKNNVTGISGMVPGATTHPIRIGGTTWSTVAAATGLQEALKSSTVNADIAVLNFWGPPSESIRTEIANNIKNGRDPFGSAPALGMVMIAPSGGSVGLSGFGTLYPANYDSVLSVIGTNPNDQVKDAGDGWALGSWGPYGCYRGHWHDVAAPTGLIMGADVSSISFYDDPTEGPHYTLLQDEQGYAAAPVVAAIAAMLLEQDPSLTWDKVNEYIIAGADKVGGYAYTWPGGKSDELASGRVNCANSTGLAAAREEAVQSPIKIWHDQNGQLLVETVAVLHGELQLTDLTGKSVASWPIAATGEVQKFTLPALAAGIYLATVRQDSGQVTQKLVIW